MNIFVSSNMASGSVLSLFQQHKRQLYTGTSPDGQHQVQIDYTLCSWRWRSSIQLGKTRLGFDCGSDYELHNGKFRLKWKKVGKTTRPFSYDLNQIPYDYTLKLKYRLKELDLIDRMPEELWMEVHNHCTGDMIKTIPKKKEMPEWKLVFWGSFTDSWAKRWSKRQRRKGKVYPSEYSSPKTSKERKERLHK